MKRHRHSTVFEWHAATHVVPYIHLDRVEVRAQQGYVVHVSEPSGHPVTVTSGNRKGAQQRRESVTHDARLHDVRVDVEGVEPLRQVHHIVGLDVEGERRVGMEVGMAGVGGGEDGR